MEKSSAETVVFSSQNKGNIYIYEKIERKPWFFKIYSISCRCPCNSDSGILVGNWWFEVSACFVDICFLGAVGRFSCSCEGWSFAKPMVFPGTLVTEPVLIAVCMIFLTKHPRTDITDTATYCNDYCNDCFCRWLWLFSASPCLLSCRAYVPKTSCTDTASMSVAEDQSESPEALCSSQGAGLDSKVWLMFDLHQTSSTLW